MALISLIYASAVLIIRTIEIIKSYFNIDNPLIPDYLFKDIAFPYVIIAGIFIIIAVLSARELRTDNKNKSRILFCFGFCVFHFLFGVYMYQFIMSFNPFG